MEQRGRKGGHRKPELWSQYLFECIVSQSTAPVANTLAGRTVGKRHICSVQWMNIFALVVADPSCLARQKSYSTLSAFLTYLPTCCYIRQYLMLLGTSLSQSLWWMAASKGGTMSVVPNVNIMENFCSQTYVATKWGWCYIVGVDYFKHLRFQLLLCIMHIDVYFTCDSVYIYILGTSHYYLSDLPQGWPCRLKHVRG